MKVIYAYRSLVVALCAFTVAWFFFLPWIKVHSVPAAAFKRLCGGRQSAAIITTSGAGVPEMANGSCAKTMIQVLGRFFGSVENVDKKSYLVWILPILAIMVAAASIAWKGRWIVSVLLGLLCIAIAVGGTFKIVTTDLDGALFRVQICFSLWGILLAYGVAGAVHLISVPVEIESRR